MPGAGQPLVIRSTSEAAEVVIKRLRSLLQDMQQVVIGWPGGRSPRQLIMSFIPLFAEIARDDRERVYFAQVDERLKGDDEREHNITVLDELLFNPLTKSGVVKPDHILRYPLDERNAEYAITNYRRMLTPYGGRFHVVILGVGEDGHVAGCFPNHPSSRATKRGFFAYDEAPKPPAGRMTATLTYLAEAELGVALFLGDGKKEALDRFLDPSVKLIDCPAKIVLQMGEAIVLTDQNVLDRARAKGA